MYSISLQIDFEPRNLDLHLDVSAESNYYGTSTPNKDHPPSHKKATIERSFQPPMENIEKENTTLAAGNVELQDHPTLHKKVTIERCFEPPMENIEKENTTLASGNVELNKEDHPPLHKKVTIERCFEPPMENIEKENTTLASGNVKLNKVPLVRSVFVFFGLYCALKMYLENFFHFQNVGIKKMGKNGSEPEKKIPGRTTRLASKRPMLVAGRTRNKTVKK